MSYRKIEVDGVEYQYTIGKTHVKVRGLGVWSKEDIGDSVAKQCECCGESLEHLHGRENLLEHEFQIRVRPRHVVSKIRETVHLDAQNSM